MSVQAELDSPRRIAADLQEQRSEVLVVDVEVIVIDVDRLVAVELELPVDLFPVESVRLLLGHSDEDHSVPCSSLTPELVAGLVLVFLVLELMEGDLLPLGQGLYRRTEFLGDLTQHDRRWDWLA